MAQKVADMPQPPAIRPQTDSTLLSHSCLLSERFARGGIQHAIYQLAASRLLQGRGCLMPVITMASPKGGVGKSTAAVILATQLAESDASVTIIDADPNRPVSRWAARPPGRPRNLTLIDNVTEQTIIRAIDDAARKSSFVIVDLEGTASMTVVYAISRADLVIIPTSASLLDAVEAVSAVQLVQRQEEAFRMKIPSAVLFTKTSAAIRTRTLTSIEGELAANKVQMFSTRLHEREAFRAIFSYGGTLSNLDQKNVRNIPAAVENAQAFAAEVIEMLKTQKAALSAVA